MSYKQKQPKLTDTLDVFIDRVEAIEKSIKKLEELNKNIDSKNSTLNYELDQKIKLIRNTELRVDLSNFKSKSTDINNELIGIYKDASNKMKADLNTLNQFFNKLSKYRIDYVIYFITVLICITISSMFFAGNQYAKKNREEKLKEHYLRFIQSNETVRKIYEERK